MEPTEFPPNGEGKVFMVRPKESGTEREPKGSLKGTKREPNKSRDPLGYQAAINTGRRCQVVVAERCAQSAGYERHPVRDAQRKRHSVRDVPCKRCSM